MLLDRILGRGGFTVFQKRGGGVFRSLTVKGRGGGGGVTKKTSKGSRKCSVCAYARVAKGNHWSKAGSPTGTVNSPYISAPDIRPHQT